MYKGLYSVYRRMEQDLGQPTASKYWSASVGHIERTCFCTYCMSNSHAVAFCIKSLKWSFTCLCDVKKLNRCTCFWETLPRFATEQNLWHIFVCAGRGICLLYFILYFLYIVYTLYFLPGWWINIGSMYKCYDMLTVQSHLVVVAISGVAGIWCEEGHETI